MEEDGYIRGFMEFYMKEVSAARCALPPAASRRRVNELLRNAHLLGVVANFSEIHKDT